MAQVIDKGRIVAAVDKYPVKENGQVVMENGQPKLKNKWMAIGEATKWQNNDGSVSETRRIYLQPISVKDGFFEERTFWDSESTQQAPQQQQQQPQQQYQQPGGFTPR